MYIYVCDCACMNAVVFPNRPNVNHDFPNRPGYELCLARERSPIIRIHIHVHVHIHIHVHTNVHIYIYIHTYLGAPTSTNTIFGTPEAELKTSGSNNRGSEGESSY